VKSIAELESAVHRARSASHTTVIVIETDPDAWTEGGAFWEVGVPETSEREAVQIAREAMVTGKRNQRSGW
jgi:3D-(3,5/4)-trihydroxycyclohexane-1,2-dione acylhydrolase (decyclizing)